MTLQWNTDESAWTQTLSNDVFDDLIVRVMTDGEASLPTPIQLQAVDEVQRLTKGDLAQIDDLTRAYASEVLDPDEFDEMDDDEFAVEFHSAMVPRLRDSRDTYVLFAGESEIDMEHGLGFICKNGKQWAVIAADHVYENYDWDSLSELDQLVNDS